MYTYGITGSSINEFGDVTIAGVADDQILQYNSSTGKWENVNASAVAGATVLDGLGDVTAPAPSSGDFLKWSGTAWVNDAIDLGTDTNGNFVADVAAGSGISVTHTPGEGSTATVALNSTLDLLSDVDAYATQQWPGPFTVTAAAGAPTSGTGTVGSYYIDATNPMIGVLYGPKQGDDTWPLIGNQNTAFFVGTLDPVDVAAANVVAGSYYLKFSFTPPSTITPLSIWGPFTAAGVSERSLLGYDQATRTWKASADEYALTTDGGNVRAAVTNVTGNFGINPNLFSHFEYTLTGTTNFSTFPIPAPRLTSGDTRSSQLIIALKQGGSGGYTVTWPASFSWPGGVAPVLSTRVGDVDMFHAISYDRGVTWHVQQLASGASRNNISSVSTKTADYTIARGDMGNIVVLDGANNHTFTIPTNATMPVPVGSRFTIGTMAGGHITLAGAVGVTLTGSTSLNSSGTIAEVIKVAADTWISHH